MVCASWSLCVVLQLLRAANRGCYPPQLTVTNNMPSSKSKMGLLCGERMGGVDGVFNFLTKERHNIHGEWQCFGGVLLG